MRRLLLGFVLLCTTLFTNAWAEDNPQAIIIFDASGSMWGQINGVTKIEIAKDALKNVVNEWNPKVELGLTVYGHRFKGDCNDIESIIPVGKVNKSQMIQTVMDIQPKGKTPISRSLKKAAEELKFTEEKATIILISDGKENCDPDPCATAKELQEQGIDFVTHVVGFDVDQKTDKQLACIAHATGGEYFSAKNAAALNESIQVIAKKVEQVEPEPKPVVKKLKNNLKITASEEEGGKWIESFHRIYPIIDTEKQDEIEQCQSEKKKECIEQLPVGNYSIHSTYNEFKKDTEFEILPGEVTQVHIVMGQTGKVEITASEEEGGKWIKSFHRIYPIIDTEKQDEIEQCQSEKKKECIEQLPVGNYSIHSTYNEFKKDTEFEILPGEVTRIHINFAPFHVSVKGINKCTMITHEVISAKGRVVAETEGPANKGADFVLPDGVYYIESKAGNITRKNKIIIGDADIRQSVVADFGGEETLGSAEGFWETSEGQAEIHLDNKQVHGTYTTDNGEIIGEMTYPQKFEGFWIEDSSGTKCAEAKNGRYHWGTLVWEFDDDMCSFKGKWSYCNNKPDRRWEGTFIKPLLRNAQETPVVDDK